MPEFCTSTWPGTLGRPQRRGAPPVFWDQWRRALL